MTMATNFIPTERIRSARLILLGILVACAAISERMSASERLLVQRIRILQPGPDGFTESAPVDLLIEDGIVRSLEPPGTVGLKPGDMRLLGEGRWLVPAPAVSVQGTVSSFDLVLAGLSGVGGLVIEAAPPKLKALWARAALDTSALPARLPAGSAVQAAFSSAEDGAFTLENAAIAIGGTQVLVDALSKATTAGIMPGQRAASLLLLEDPRLHSETVLNPHAVILGSDVVLRSERLVRVEEAIKAEALPRLPKPEKPAPTEAGDWTRRFDLVIDGLYRGEAWLEVDQVDSTTVRATVRSRVAPPIEEELTATMEWPSGVASLTLRSQGRLIEARSERSESTMPLELSITLDGTPIAGSPMVLEAGDLFLPHTLLVLLDALRKQSESSSTARIVELEALDAVPGVYASLRQAFQDPGREQKFQLAPKSLRDLGSAPRGSVKILPVEGVPTEPGVLLLDESQRPVVYLLDTPWGLLEWSKSLTTPSP
jgi:hypothetical protein